MSRLAVAEHVVPDSWNALSAEHCLLHRAQIRCTAEVDAEPEPYGNGRKTMKIYCRCRTRSCAKRQIIRSGVVSKTKCITCGEKTLRVDNWANTRQWRKHTCQCSGYFYPHRRGSLSCLFQKNGEEKVYEDALGLSEAISLDDATSPYHPSDEYF